MVKHMYKIFRFCFELLCILIAGYWGIGLAQYGNWRFLLGVLAPLLIIIIWGIWGAPSSKKRLSGNARLIFELSIYAVVALCLYNTGFQEFTVWFVLVAVVNAGINHFTNWQI